MVGMDDRTEHPAGPGWRTVSFVPAGTEPIQPARPISFGGDGVTITAYRDDPEGFTSWPLTPEQATAVKGSGTLVGHVNLGGGGTAPLYLVPPDVGASLSLLTAPPIDPDQPAGCVCRLYVRIDGDQLVLVAVDCPIHGLGGGRSTCDDSPNG
jgi:hypothetical protein